MTASAKDLKEDVIPPNMYTNVQYQTMQKCDSGDTVYDSDYYGLAYKYGRWDQMEDCLDERKIKEEGTKYLPLTPGQLKANSADMQKLYYWYIKNAQFPETLQKYSSDMQGMLFSEQTVFELPDSLKSMNDNANNQGDSLQTIDMSISSNQLGTGRIGVLCDPDMSVDTIAPPKLVQYGAKSILNWKSINDYLCDMDYIDPDFRLWYRDNIGEYYGAKWVLLDESTYDDMGSMQDRFRLIGLDGDGDYYNMIVEDMQKFNCDSPWECFGVSKDQAIEDRSLYYPSIKGIGLRFVPFTVINSTRVGFDCYNPLLLPVSELQIALYNIDALLKQAVQSASQPVLCITGVENPESINANSFVVGGNMAIVVSDKEAKIYYAETSGSGVNTLMQIIDNLKDQLRKIGVELEASANTSGVALNISLSTLTAPLNSLALTRESGWDDILTNCLMWVNPKLSRDHASKEIVVQCNKDFKPESVDSQLLQTVLAADASNQMTNEEVFLTLDKAGLTPHESVEDRLKAKESKVMNSMPTPTMQNVDEGEFDVGGE